MQYSRRQFLIRGAGAGLSVALAPSLLAACGGSGGNTLDLNIVSLVQRFPKEVLTPGRIRLPMSLGNAEGIVTTQSGVKIPESLRFVVSDLDGNALFEDDFVVQAHITDVPQPYWPLVVDLKEPGTYIISLLGFDAAGAAFQVKDASEVAIPTVGSPLPPIDTPTTQNARGITPICTRKPEPCPLHDVNLRDALTMGKPVVYLLGTPAYCQTGTCTPALDALLSAHKSFGDQAIFIHAEVYTDKTATVSAPAVTGHKMTFEPALFITDATGKLVERLDAIFDSSEVLDALRLNGIS
ncbi:MAG: hypothetical protein NWP73_06620 [Ilumatobacteraceae bacterium]|jgi:hypothetical protein|nr:hypothetical protein [Ilumatobacteraceae bacterium]MDP4702407.1 hypothetical protein [Ilumatobacteraceae bacterium]MDP5109420.1 hypothetical protein [Ilumatobacteraceae bacterium]